MPTWTSTGIWIYSSATTSTIRPKTRSCAESANSEERLYCDPRKFDGQVDRLYINEGRAGGWAFADRTAAFGLVSVAGKELGVVFGDYDQDGDPDLYLANDLVSNMLYRNDGTRFVDRGLASGTSLNGEGVAEAGDGR